MGEHYRSRGIYKSLVYEADVNIDGIFKIPNIRTMTDHLHKVRYDKAFIIIGLTDTKAINEVSKLQFNDSSFSFEPGVRQEIGGLSSGFHAPIPVSSKVDHYRFSFGFNTKGSSSLRFTAFGEKTQINIKSSWRHPSFQGGILPTSHNITDEGFAAEWIMPSLARNFPQAWIDESIEYDVHALLTGVDLYEPVFLYSMIERSVKYAILFIALTYLTFLIYELVLKSKLHYVQYGLIGLSLAMFYLILLSLSEHVSFLSSYLCASLVTTLSISAYTYFVNKKPAQSLAVLVLLIALYSILYSILQLEDYALLMGTALLLSVLLVLMWLTRNLRVDESGA
jgi:inner membrane protein